MSDLSAMLTELEWLEGARTDPSVTADEWSTRGNQLLARAGGLSKRELAEFETAFSAFQQRERDAEMDQWIRTEIAGNTPVHTGGDLRVDHFRIGAVAVSVPTLDLTMGPELVDAVARRRDADLTGECACGALATIRDGVYTITHTRDCKAADEVLSSALQAFYDQGA